MCMCIVLTTVAIPAYVLVQYEETDAPDTGPILDLVSVHTLPTVTTYVHAKPWNEASPSLQN